MFDFISFYFDFFHDFFGFFFIIIWEIKKENMYKLEGIICNKFNINPQLIWDAPKKDVVVGKVKHLV